VLLLAIVMFFWIWLFPYLGAKGYWVALVSFGVCIAYGASLIESLPWMTVATVGGTVLGLGAYTVAMKMLPLYYALSFAIAGAVFILIAGLLSSAKLRELLPMNMVAIGCFLGVMTSYDLFFSEQPIQAIHTTLTAFVGVLLSLLFGMMVAVVLQALVLAPRRAATPANIPAEPPKIME
jgi:hypothetical protein